MTDSTDDKPEVTSAKDSPATAKDKLAPEVDTGRQDMVDRQKALANSLKQGASSGITGEFGKLTFQAKEAANAILASRETDAATGTKNPSGTGDTPANTETAGLEAGAPAVLDRSGHKADVSADKTPHFDGDGSFDGYMRYREIENSPDIKKAREDILRAPLPGDQQDQMKKDMENFEKRAAWQYPPVSKDEVLKTYQEVHTLLQAKDTDKIKQPDRQMLAEQIVHHAANPGGIDQGDHNTCSVATVESRMFSRNPSKAAELIREVATTGQYDCGGVPVKIDCKSLEKHVNDGGFIEEDGKLPTDGNRSFASQIFQVTAVNIGHKFNETQIKDDAGNTVTYPPGTLEYRQYDAQAGTRPPDTGERLFDTRTGHQVTRKHDASEVPVCHPELSDGAIPDIYSRISGNKPPESGIMLAHDGAVVGKGENVTQFSDMQEFKEQLYEAQKAGKMPVILKVNTAQEPFFADSGGGAAGGSGAEHVVTVTKYDGNSNSVEIANQWGQDSSNKMVKVEDLYRSTLAPEKAGDAIPSLEKECALYAKADRVDYAKEMELVRLKHLHGDPPTGQAEYDHQMQWLAKQSAKEAIEKNNGVIDKTANTELKSWLGKAYTESPEGKSPHWNQITGNIREDVALAVIGRNGVMKDSQGEKIALPTDYATKDMRKESEEVYKSLNWYNEPERLKKALDGKTPAQLKQMDELFKKDHDVSIDEYLCKNLSGSKQEAARAQLHKYDTNWSTGEDTTAGAPHVGTSDKGVPALVNSAQEAAQKELENSNRKLEAKRLEGNEEDFQNNLSKQRDKLTSIADTKITDTQERDNFKQDMAKLDTRRDKIHDLYQKQFLHEGFEPEDADRLARKKSLAEVTTTYEQVSRILETKGDKPLRDADRVKLAEEVMYHAGEPTQINQGQNATCHVTTIEARLFTRSPSTVATMLADVATTGEYQSKGYPPQRVKLDDASLTPDEEAKKNDYRNANRRTYASQLFQVTAATMAWKAYGDRQTPPLDLHYEDHDGNPVIVDYSKTPHETLKRNANDVSDDEVVQTSNQITGKGEKQIVLHRADSDDNCAHIDSSEDLGRQLLFMKKHGKLPALLKVHSGKEPLLTDSGYGSAGGSGDWHFVTITDYDPSKGKVELDNQWGNQNDHLGNRALDLDTVFKLMDAPKH